MKYYTLIKETSKPNFDADELYTIELEGSEYSYAIHYFPILRYGIINIDGVNTYSGEPHEIAQQFLKSDIFKQTDSR